MDVAAPQRHLHKPRGRGGGDRKTERKKHFPVYRNSISHGPLRARRLKNPCDKIINGPLRVEKWGLGQKSVTPGIISDILFWQSIQVIEGHTGNVLVQGVKDKKKLLASDLYQSLKTRIYGQFHILN